MPPEVLTNTTRDVEAGMVRVALDDTKWDVFSYAVMVTFILRSVRICDCVRVGRLHRHLVGKSFGHSRA